MVEKKELIDFVIKYPENIEKILFYLEDLSKNISFGELIVLGAELLKRELPIKTKELILKFLAEFCEKNFLLEESLRFYQNLLKLTPKEEYLIKLEEIRTFKFLGRFRYLIPSYPLNFEVLKELYFKSIETNESVENLITKNFNVPKDALLKAIGKYYNLPAYDLKKLLAKGSVKRLTNVLTVKRLFFEKNLSIPLGIGKEVFLFIYFPENKEIIEKIKRVLQISKFTLAFALKEDILETIRWYFETPLEIEILEEELIEEEPTEELVDNTIVNLVNSIIEEGYRRRASDIHWESLPGNKGLLVRFRIDGECHDYVTLPNSQKRPCISRIKIMSNLDIAERRLPQDGKIKFITKDGKKFEIRVATIPTIENNEDVVMRILGGIEFRTLEQLDLLPETYENLKKILNLPYGLILCVGPTGSGKTTTLHACLKYLNKPNKKIWTAEDPVEIVQEGLRQVQVNPKIGLTFARVLRAFLRADPDIIMIGETRDIETAQILVEASLTGHLVLSTLHTNSAPETIPRLLGMGIDPFTFADSLLGIIAQRLAKRLCSKCKKPYQPSEKELLKLKREYGENPLKPLNDELIAQATFYQPVGCEACNYTGFRGRIALHELLVIDNPLKDLIINKASAEEIRNYALSKGFLTLKQDGVLKILKGETTLKEVLAVTLR